jgi:hypothetical protein
MIRQTPSPRRVTITNSARSFATPMIAIRSSPCSCRSSMSSSQFGLQGPEWRPKSRHRVSEGSRRVCYCPIRTARSGYYRIPVVLATDDDGRVSRVSPIAVGRKMVLRRLLGLTIAGVAHLPMLGIGWRAVTSLSRPFTLAGLGPKAC